MTGNGGRETNSMPITQGLDIEKRKDALAFEELEGGDVAYLPISARIRTSNGGFKGIAWMQGRGRGTFDDLTEYTSCCHGFGGLKGSTAESAVWRGFGDMLVIDCGFRGCWGFFFHWSFGFALDQEKKPCIRSQSGITLN